MTVNDENRNRWERRIARDVARTFSQQFDRLMGMLSENPALGDIDPDYFEQTERELRQLFIPMLDDIATSQAEEYPNSALISPSDFSIVNRAASEWARNYSFDLVRGINDNTRRNVQNVIASAFEESLTRADVERQLAPAFGPTRAATIATTETTRAAVQGELAVVNVIEAENPAINLVSVWITANDDKVCPICAPLNGKEYGDGWTDPPPAHVNCLCDLSHEFRLRQ